MYARVAHACHRAVLTPRPGSVSCVPRGRVGADGVGSGTTAANGAWMSGSLVDVRSWSNVRPGLRRLALLVYPQPRSTRTRNPRGTLRPFGAARFSATSLVPILDLPDHRLAEHDRALAAFGEFMPSS